MFGVIYDTRGLLKIFLRKSLIATKCQIWDARIHIENFLILVLHTDCTVQKE